MLIWGRLMTALINRLVVYRWTLFVHALLIQILWYAVLCGNIFCGNLSITVILSCFPAETPRNVYVFLCWILNIFCLWCVGWSLVLSDHWNFHLETSITYKWLRNLFILERTSILMEKRFLLVNFLVFFGVLKVDQWPIYWGKIVTKLS